MRGCGCVCACVYAVCALQAQTDQVDTALDPEIQDHFSKLRFFIYEANSSLSGFMIYQTEKVTTAGCN